MLKFTLNQACTDTSLAVLQRDQLLYGASGGVLSLYDIANSYCYDSTTSPTTAKVLTNINESGNNGSLVVLSGQTLSNAGGGISFAALTDKNSYAKGNAAPLSDLWGAGSGLQYFMYCIYVKLPLLADWNTSSSAFAMLQFGADTGDYRTVADLLALTQSNGGGLFFRRQKAISSVDALGLTPVTADYGSVVQLAFWRNADGQGARLKSANGTVLTTSAVSTANSEDFSACTQKVGSVGTFNIPAAGNENAAKWRYYRSFLENLTTSGRDPTTVLDADYTRTIARGVFS